MQTLSASFFFLLSGLNVYAGLACGTKAVDLYRHPLEIPGGTQPQTVGITLFCVATLIFALVSIGCVRRGCARLDEPDEVQEHADEW